MSENFYPPEKNGPRVPYALVAILVLLALLGGIGAGYLLARATWRDSNQTIAVPATDQDGVPRAMPVTDFKPKREAGSLQTYRLDAEITGGGSDSGEFSDIYMKIGSDVSLYTRDVAEDGTANLRFVFDNTSLTGTFLENPLELHFTTTVPDTAVGEENSSSHTDSPESFLTRPIDLRVGPNGDVLSVSGPSSLHDMLGSIVTVPQIEFPEGELVEGRQWTYRFSMPVPGIPNAIDTTVSNTYLGIETMADRQCGVVRQILGATEENTHASAGVGNDDRMVFSVPLFDLRGENMIYFDINTGSLVHATLDMNFSLRIKEQLGEAANFLQQLLRGLSDENTYGDKILSQNESPDLLDLSVKIDGAISLVNEGPPLPLQANGS